MVTKVGRVTLWSTVALIAIVILAILIYSK
jgi:hypothetical protein